ncbi:MAG: response regulator [Flavobacteriales bacterium]|nr:response regulator [Flavobacteriales bacterium]MBP6697381.1 response regulator [Flavobacteriales bacterium]
MSMDHTGGSCSHRGALTVALYLTLLIAPGLAVAQMGLVDSLNNVLRTTGDSLTKADLLIKIGDMIFYDDVDSAIACFDQARKYARGASAGAFRAKLVLRQGMIHDYRAVTAKGSMQAIAQARDQAIIFHDSALAMAKAMDDQVLLAEIHHWRGETFKGQGKYDLALGEYYNGLAAAELAKDDRSLMIGIHDLSLMLKIEGREEEARTMMREASALAEKLQDHEWLIDIGGHMGEDAQADGDMEAAVVHFTRALEFAKRRKDKGNTVWNMDRIGVVRMEQGRLDEAMRWFQQVLALNKEAEPLWNALTYDHLGALLLKQDRPREALHYYLISHELYKQEPVPSEEAAKHLSGLSKVYAALDRYELAYENAIRSHAITDSIVKARQEKDLTQLRMQTEFERTRQEELVRQQHRDQLAAAELTQQRTIRNISIAGVFVVILLLVLVERQRRRAAAAQRRAENSERSKQRFLANMSHEIRTPMNAIMGMTGILKRNEQLPEQKKYLDAIAQSSENLLVVLNDILDMSKIEAGKIQLEQVAFHPRSVIGNVREILQFKAEEKGIGLSVEIDDHVPAMLKGDPTRLQQVLINLAGNAIKFTEKGSVTIRAAAVETDDAKATLRIEVIDTGIGIPLDKQQRIFEEFDQAYSDTGRKYGGTGLGLSISKRLVELQGGSITVQSEKGQGSTFTVAIPYAITVMSAEPAAASGTSDLKDLRILLAEDNDFNVMVAQDELADAIPGVQVDVAANGRIAVEMAQGKEYDVILMDVQMPEMNGYDATKAIRALPGDKSRTPIVAMTANVLKEEVERCKAAGMDGYVPKPFKREELIGAIQMVLDR